MAKGIKDTTRTVSLRNNAAIASGSDLLLTEVDMMTSRNGLLIVSTDISTTEYIADMRVVTAATSDFFVSGTAAATSDIVDINIDARNSSSTPTVTSNLVSIIADGTYIFNVKNLKRYTNVQYMGTGTSTIATVNLLGLDMEQAPYSDATAAY